MKADPAGVLTGSHYLDGDFACGEGAEDAGGENRHAAENYHSLSAQPVTKCTANDISAQHAHHFYDHKISEVLLGLVECAKGVDGQKRNHDEHADPEDTIYQERSKTFVACNNQAHLLKIIPEGVVVDRGLGIWLFANKEPRHV